MTEVDQALTENGWVTYTESESGHSYLTLIEEELYYVELDADENGNLKDWYLNNWREGEDIAEVLKNLTGEKTDQEDAWKSVYLNYIETNTQIEDPEKGTHREIYKLLDLNEDGVPELYINFGSTAGGDAILRKWTLRLSGNYRSNRNILKLDRKCLDSRSFFNHH